MNQLIFVFFMQAILGINRLYHVDWQPLPFNMWQCGIYKWKNALSIIMKTVWSSWYHVICWHQTNFRFSLVCIIYLRSKHHPFRSEFFFAVVLLATISILSFICFVLRLLWQSNCVYSIWNNSFSGQFPYEHILFWHCYFFFSTAVEIPNGHFVLLRIFWDTQFFCLFVFCSRSVKTA